MIPLTLAEIAAATGVDLRNCDPATVVTGTVEYDSRQVTAGGLFVALTGDRVDGHDFAVGAIGAGAVAVPAPRPLPVPTVLVESTTVSAAHSAAATGDCTAPYPISDVTAGQAVHGLTVTQGTTPSPFTGDGLGVLKDGIIPGIDLVMVRLDSTEIQRVGGIWQGMSGSPVYAADGRLIGAVAYGFAAGPSPVAGVTPFATGRAATRGVRAVARTTATNT